MRPEIKLKACIDQTLMHLVEVVNDQAGQNAIAGGRLAGALTAVHRPQIGGGRCAVDLAPTLIAYQRQTQHVAEKVAGGVQVIKIDELNVAADIQ